MELHNLRSPSGATKKRRRVGRGESSGWGKTAGKGHKGQLARTGKGKPRAGFEGGQLPMYRRMPKRGFTNIFAKKWFVLNVGRLAAHFVDGDTVDLAALNDRGIAKGRYDGLRVIGEGEVLHKLTIKAVHVSAGARVKLESAGGQVFLEPSSR